MVFLVCTSMLGLLLIQMVLWVVFSGYFDAFFLSAGAVSSLLSVAVCYVIGAKEESGSRYEPPRGSAARFCRIIFLYLPWIFGQAVLSAWFVTKRVFAPNVRDMSAPVMALVETGQSGELGAFILANSITLTPGTVGMNVTRDYKVEVLALDKSLIPGVAEIDNRVSAILGEHA
ncbi:sodium:proton antiporter [Anaplasma marginale str. Gypsy Plains]|uniref:Conserved family-Na+/H+ antiporter n=3 Tax=Anaplasma marginale TaxID=770 RepID=B9KHW7_ANAMF|nr:Conserved family - Na+/H+ antiporter [Anaplasma marginale str. Florida]AGZ78646.1 sodium:proton antiporter [Anaplasma marginale str. Gypsy Plains]